MALIGEMQYLTIGGNTYSIPISGGSTVTIERALTSGTKSATISVDGSSYDLYAPTPNAGTVTSVTLTQGTGITVSNSGTAITTSGSRTISLASITKDDTTSTASPSHGGTFTAIDSITYDTYGRVTGVNTKTVTLPVDSNTDTKVTQAYSTANSNYPILFSATAGVSSIDSRGDTTAILNNAIYANPSTGNLYVTQLNGITVGDSPKFTDEKLEVTEVTSGNQYYPLVGSGATAATRQYDTTGFKYKGTTGTTSAVGSAIVELGNSTASGTAGNKQGQLIIYGTNAKKATITLAAPSADIALALPTSGGTIALTSQLPSVPTSANNATTGISIAAHSSTSIYGVKSTTTTASKASGGNGSASSWTFSAATVGDGTLKGEVDGTDSTILIISANTTTVQQKTGGSNGTAPTWSFTDVTVPIRNDSTTTVVTSTGHTITDNGHTHTLS